MSPLNRGSSHFSPISIGRCHTGESELWLRHPAHESYPSKPSNGGGLSSQPKLLSPHLLAPLHIAEPMNTLLAETQLQLGSHHFACTAPSATRSRSTICFFWAFLFFLRTVAAQSPTTAEAAQAKRRTASWVVSFHFSSKSHKASMDSR
ncbi:hypothetical protein QQP08_021827 [Theobroma cacao]|nr:hypothetical protein QQP08_021827 [Theobroma cacao]